MTWFAQVRHVMMKDMRLARWNTGVYVLIVALSTAAACSSFGLQNVSPIVLMLVLVLFGMMVIGWLVQVDSPTQANVFWASRPIDPTAMLAAKVLLAVLVLIGLPALGEITALSAYGVSPGDIPLFLLKSVLSYGEYLLIAIIVAALTKDIPAFVLALIVTLFSLVAAAGLLFQPAAAYLGGQVGFITAGGVPSTDGASISAIVFVVGDLALLAFLYRRRDVRRGVFLAGFAAVICASWTLSTFSRKPAVPDAPSSIRRVPVMAELTRSQPIDAQFVVKVSAPAASDSEWLTLIEPVLTIHARSGATFALPLSGERADLRQPMPALGGVSWMDSNSVSVGKLSSQLQVRLTFAQREMIAAGIASMSLDGRIAVLDSHAGGTFPIQVGESFHTDRKQTRIEKWNYGGGDASLELLTSEIPHAADEPIASHGLGSPNLVGFALVNQARRQALPLRIQGSSGGDGSVVLPGVDLQRTTVTLRTYQRGLTPADPKLDNAWFHDARLMIVKWTRRGSYPVHAEVMMPTPP